MSEDSNYNSVKNERLVTTEYLFKSGSPVESADNTIIIFDQHKSCLAFNPAELELKCDRAKTKSLSDWIEILKKWAIEQIEQFRTHRSFFAYNSALFLKIERFKFTESHDIECQIGITFKSKGSDRLQKLLPEIQQPDPSTEENTTNKDNLSSEKLLIHIEALQQELQTLKREKLTLEIILDRMVEQTNVNESRLQKKIIEQQKAQAVLLEINEELEKLIFTDSLTQIANRRQFDDYLLQQWQKLRQTSAFLSPILCDIDYFKVYNDTYGHLIGDYCLQQVALSLESIVESYGGLAARYGGEEFGIILPNTDSQQALAIANEMRLRVKSLKIEHQNSPVCRYVTLSLGVYSLIPNSNSSPELAIAMADRALYEAKAQGRDRACLYRD